MGKVGCFWVVSMLHKWVKLCENEQKVAGAAHVDLGAHGPPAQVHAHVKVDSTCQH